MKAVEIVRVIENAFSVSLMDISKADKVAVLEELLLQLPSNLMTQSDKTRDVAEGRIKALIIENSEVIKDEPGRTAEPTAVPTAEPKRKPKVSARTDGRTKV